MKTAGAERSALIDAARDGDAAAIGRLLEICQPDIRRFARRSCSNAEDAEDAVQLALWQLHRKIGSLRTAATLATWLFRVVERECFRLFRRQPDTDPLDDEIAKQITAQQSPIELRMDLCLLIAELPPIYRDVLILRDIHELTAPEAAAKLGLTIQAIKSRLHRARMLMRNAYVAKSPTTVLGSTNGVR